MLVIFDDFQLGYRDLLSILMKEEGIVYEGTESGTARHDGHTVANSKS